MIPNDHSRGPGGVSITRPGSANPLEYGVRDQLMHAGSMQQFRGGKANSLQQGMIPTAMPSHIPTDGLSVHRLGSSGATTLLMNSPILEVLYRGSIGEER